MVFIGNASPWMWEHVISEIKTDKFIKRLRSGDTLKPLNFLIFVLRYRVL